MQCVEYCIRQKPRCTAMKRRALHRQCGKGVWQEISVSESFSEEATQTSKMCVWGRNIQTLCAFYILNWSLLNSKEHLRTIFKETMLMINILFRNFKFKGQKFNENQCKRKREFTETSVFRQTCIRELQWCHRSTLLVCLSLYVGLLCSYCK